MHPFKSYLAIVLLLICLTTAGQKVGLVLSGGGAKGLAHIGVIKVLEDNNIPIDYIAGTSIGAIVAGLYAAGYSPNEMIELFKSDEFRLWSSGKVNKDDLFYFKQLDENPDWLKLDIARKQDRIKLLLPTSFVPERQMDFAFMQMMATTNAACNNDFDQLMIPFRAVSTDIYKKEAVVLKSGNVGEAIRASMTFPLYFKPIEIDGILLFDGGIVNNFPIDVMKKDFNPDIIIGHKVAGTPKRPDPDDVLEQIETMVMQKTDYSIPDSIGILLETNLENVSLMNFDKVDFINSKGIETGLIYIDSIKSKISRRVTKEEVTQHRKEFNRKKPQLLFNSIQVEGISDDQQRKYIIQSIKGKERVIDITQLRSSYYKLIADEHIKSIRPMSRYNKLTGYFDLNLKVELRKPIDISFGGNLSTRSNTMGFIEANYKSFKKQAYTLTSNLYFGRFYSSFMAGGRVDSPTETPFYYSAYFTYNIWDYYSTNTDIFFDNSKPSYIVSTENNFRVEAGFPYSTTGIVDLGVSHSLSSDDYYQSASFSRNDTPDNTQIGAYSGYIRIDRKNFDFKQFPTEGAQRKFEFRFINGSEKYRPGTTAPDPAFVLKKHAYIQMKALFDQYFPINKRLTFGLLAEGIFNNNELYSNYTVSKLNAPGFSPTPNSMSMYSENFHANRFFAGGGKVVYKLSDNVHLRTEAYWFFPIQNILKDELNKPYLDEHPFNSRYKMAMGALVYHTKLGPLSIVVDYFDKSSQKWFFSINMGYMIFNKRGY